MPSDRPLTRLNDILVNIERITQYTRDQSLEDFIHSHLTIDAVERCLLRISEAAKKLEGTVDELAPDQPWSEIRSLGNVIRHEYDVLDIEIIWNIVKNDLPPLRKAVEGAIKKFESRR